MTSCKNWYYWCTVDKRITGIKHYWIALLDIQSYSWSTVTSQYELMTINIDDEQSGLNKNNLAMMKQSPRWIGVWVIRVFLKKGDLQIIQYSAFRVKWRTIFGAPSFETLEHDELNMMQFNKQRTLCQSNEDNKCHNDHPMTCGIICHVYHSKSG